MRQVEVRGQTTRTCLGCRCRLPQSNLLRIALSPRGLPVSDLRKRLPGRGAYVCYASSCMKSALAPERLRRALRSPVGEIDPAAWQKTVVSQLEESVRNLLCIACKARKAVAGRLEIRRSMENDSLWFVVMASDCGFSRRREAEEAFRSRGVPFLALFTAAELGGIVGGGPLDMAGITDRGFAQQLTTVSERLISLSSAAAEGRVRPVSPSPTQNGSPEGR